jgi:hypothetical protein
MTANFDKMCCRKRKYLRRKLADFTPDIRFKWDRLLCESASLRVCESCESASRASHAGRASHASDRGGSRGSQISHAPNVKKAYKKFWTKVFEFFPSANTSFYFWSRNQNSITLQHINFDQFLHIEPAID